MSAISLNRRFIPDDQPNIKLLTIALEELPKPKPLRRSQLARRDYVPAPVSVLPEPKKACWKGLLKLLRAAVILILAALGLLAIKAGNDWFDHNFAYGALKPGPYSMYVGGNDETNLPDGRVVKTLYKGILPDKSQLPPVASSQIGDMWFTKKDGNYWVLATLTPTSAVIGWVDP